MKIVLCTPPSMTKERWPPIGLLYIASYLKANGYNDVSIVDAFSCNMNEDELVDAVKKENPDIIGMNSTTHTFLDTISATKKIKEILPEIKIVLGGYQATFNAKNIFMNYKFVDFVIKGEGERSFLELIDCLSKKKSLKEIKGISYLGNRFINNNPDIIEDLDSLPFPDRTLVEKNDYNHYWNKIRLTFGKFTTILTSRGCPYNCRYCSCSAFTNRSYRERSIDNVIDEFEEIYSQGYRTCIVVDDNFTLNKKRVMKICEELKRRRIDLDLHCEGRVDSASSQLLDSMKKAGFSTIYFGIESGLQKVLDYYRKGTTIEQIRRAVRNAKKVKMNIIGSFILGSPIENKRDIMHTLKFASSLHMNGIQLNILDIYPGTELWSELEKNGKIGRDDWKRRHLIYEYSDNLKKEYLCQAVDQGYRLFFDGWKDFEAVKDLFLSFLFNRTIRKIFAWNLYKNPRNVIQAISGR